MDSFYTQLGALNASLVGAEFSDTAPSADELAAMLRTARGLHVYARQRLEAARHADWFCSMTKESELENVAAEPDVKDTPCVGPCVVLWRGANENAKLRELIKSMQETSSSQTAQSLFCQVMELKPSGAADAERYQMCQLTGFPCSVFRIFRTPDQTPDQTGQEGEATATQERGLQEKGTSIWSEAVRESGLLQQYAEHVAHGHILNMEAAAAPPSSSLRGGAAHRHVVKQCASLLKGRHSHDVVRTFYRYQPDHKGRALSQVLAELDAALASGKEDALDFLVSGAVVEPLVKRASMMSQSDVRTALRAKWQTYVSTAIADFSSAQ